MTWEGAAQRTAGGCWEAPQWREACTEFRVKRCLAGAGTCVPEGLCLWTSRCEVVQQERCEPSGDRRIQGNGPRELARARERGQLIPGPMLPPRDRADLLVSFPHSSKATSSVPLGTPDCWAKLLLPLSAMSDLYWHSGPGLGLQHHGVWRNP